MTLGRLFGSPVDGEEELRRGKLFQHISGRCAEFIHVHDRIQHQELAARDLPNIRRQLKPVGRTRLRVKMFGLLAI